MKNRIIFAAFIMLMLSLISSCAVYHHYGSFMGKVIDLETKESIEGAAVLAIYYTAGYSVGGPVYHYTNAKETLTDKNGEFRIPALNNFSFRPLAYHDDRVRFTIFKPGYGVFGGMGSYPGVMIDSTSPPNSFLPSKKYVLIELPKLVSEKDREDNVIFRTDVNYNIPYQKQRAFLDAINIELESLRLNERFVNKDNRPALTEGR